MNTTIDDKDEDSNLDVQTLLDRIFRLKSLLRNANQRSESPIGNLDDLLYEGLDLESNAAKWKKTATSLKEELERYKNGAEGVYSCHPHSQRKSDGHQEVSAGFEGKF